MLDTDEKLNGYVLIDDKDRLLRRKLVWADRSVTKGWIFPESEINTIRAIAEREGWEHPPVYRHAAYLNKNDGQTYLIGEKEKLP